MKHWIKKIIEVVEERDWSVTVEKNDFEFRTFSPAGQDFCINVTADNVEELREKLYEIYNDYDPSEEAYLWLDNTGHGTNGAPNDMKDVYEDMEACEDMILKLYSAL